MNCMPPIAAGILSNLCDRLDRDPVPDRRISVAMPKRALGQDEADAEYACLRAAEVEGAVSLEWGRRVNTSHILERVVLADGAALFRFVGRKPLAERITLAEAALRPTTESANEEVLSRLISAWQAGRRPAQIGPDDTGRAAFALRVVAAFSSHDGSEVDMRTFSARALGDSKVIERELAAVARFLRFAFDLPTGMEADEVVASFGVRKFGQPRLIAGPLVIGGRQLYADPYVGLPPELLCHVSVAGAPRSILTIENLASFNRHVREVREGDDVVLYTAGFCGRELLDLVARLAEETGAPIYHWGDIDQGGVLIGRQVETAVGTLTPHLMSPDLARSRGLPVPAVDFSSMVPKDSAFHDVAQFLSSPNAHRLEQEDVDPRRPVAEG